MLELYHHGSSVCAAKVRLVLAEKDLDWKGHYIDILRGDQFDPGYMKINPKAVVPTLVHDGQVVRESTVICDYLDNVFPEPPLIPRDPLERAQMLYWTKAVDEDLHPACAAVTFICSHRHTVLRLGREKVQEFLDSTPPNSVTADWHEKKKVFVRDGFDAPGAASVIQLYDRYLDKMEDALSEGDWLAGNAYTLADIAMIPYVNRLDKMSMAGLWEERKPLLSDWWERVQARPSFRPAIIDWVPDELANDLKTFGAESWGEVKHVLHIN